jgi:hypothetical protein
MISLKQAQELHELIGAIIESENNDDLIDVAPLEERMKMLERAREISALIVCDAIEESGGRV